MSPAMAHVSVEVPTGDPAAMRADARRFAAFAEGAEAEIQRLEGTLAATVPGDWLGVAATSFGWASRALASDLGSAPSAFRAAAGALEELAAQVENAQQIARQAQAAAADLAADAARLEATRAELSQAGPLAAGAGQALATQAEALDAAAAGIRMQAGGAAEAARAAHARAAAAFEEVAAMAPSVSRALADAGKGPDDLFDEAALASWGAATWITSGEQAEALSGLEFILGHTVSGVPIGGGDRGSPEQIRAYLSSLSPGQQSYLAAALPALIGPLNGAPADMRDQANRILVERHLDGLRDQRDALAAEISADEGLDLGDVGDVLLWGPIGSSIRDSARQDRLDSLNETIAREEAWLSDEDWDILLFDPEGDGRVAMALGDVDTAEHVAVLVPGANNDITGFDGQRARATELQMATERVSGDSVATVAWLGYDSPEWAEAALRGPAEDGAPDLTAFVDGISSEGQHVTVVGHSYGSVVTGQSAVHAGLDADDIVLIGSPGAVADHASDMGGAQVWAARTPDDPIAHADQSSGGILMAVPLPPVQAVGAGMFVGDHVEELWDPAADLWHGNDPVAAEFGSIRFETGPGVEGHGEYYEIQGGVYSESVLNMARIVTGQDHLVSLAAP